MTGVQQVLGHCFYDRARFRSGSLMLVYLFRQQRTSDRALTTDITGRNLPSATPCSHWVFVEMLDAKKARPPLGVADFKEALSRVRAFGYYTFEGGRL